MAAQAALAELVRGWNGGAACCLAALLALLGCTSVGCFCAGWWGRGALGRLRRWYERRFGAKRRDGPGTDIFWADSGAADLRWH
eukprot:12297251-Alexandrium_andersonii.AAC.1